MAEIVQPQRIPRAQQWYITSPVLPWTYFEGNRFSPSCVIPLGDTPIFHMCPIHPHGILILPTERVLSSWWERFKFNFGPVWLVNLSPLRYKRVLKGDE